jgi:hypothetical protein
MFREWKLAPNTVTQRVAALRFFYVQVLKWGWMVAATPYPKKFPFHRILLMTLYTLRSLGCHPRVP